MPSGSPRIQRHDDSQLQGNTVSGANIGFQWLSGSDFAGNQAVQMMGNTLTNVKTGFLVQSSGIAHLSDNSLTNSGAMFRRGRESMSAPARSSPSTM